MLGYPTICNFFFNWWKYWESNKGARDYQERDFLCAKGKGTREYLGCKKKEELIQNVKLGHIKKNFKWKINKTN